MSTRERKQIDKDFKKLSSRNFEKPGKCRNLGQIQYYVSELANIIEDFKQRFNYVPKEAYVLLSAYNASQNRLIFSNYKSVYTP